METQFIRIRNRIINLDAISYVRLHDDLDRVDIRLLGPHHDVALTITLKGEEAEPVRRFFLDMNRVTDLRPPNSAWQEPYSWACTPNTQIGKFFKVEAVLTYSKKKYEPILQILWLPM